MKSHQERKPRDVTKVQFPLDWLIVISSTCGIFGIVMSAIWLAGNEIKSVLDDDYKADSKKLKQKLATLHLFVVF